MQRSSLYHKRRYAERTDSVDWQKEHPSTGLRRLRPEEECSGPGWSRNGRKRSGANRYARSGPPPAAFAFDPTLCSSAGGAEPRRFPPGSHPLVTRRRIDGNSVVFRRPTGGRPAVDLILTLNSRQGQRMQVYMHPSVLSWRTWLDGCPVPLGLLRRGASVRSVWLGGSRRSSTRRPLRRFATPRPPSGAGGAIWGCLRPSPRGGPKRTFEGHNVRGGRCLLPSRSAILKACKWRLNFAVETKRCLAMGAAQRRWPIEGRIWGGSDTSSTRPTTG